MVQSDDAVRAQYAAYPYPARDPKDEKTRLITGSPSHPIELDHYVFGGQRDWSKPLRALVAGGGTGDGLVQLATLLHHTKRRFEITYVDLSPESRAIAEARLKVRGIGGVTFRTGSLLDAPDWGPFDYIDCCGVLHHLPDPDAGFAALASALAPDGGLGFMDYAPHGRSGVYPLQFAFNAMLGHLPVTDRVAEAKKILAKLPEGHPFKRNTQLVDHKGGDAEFFDLLLHAVDRPYNVSDLTEALEKAGLTLAGLLPEGAYDPARFGPVPEGLSPTERRALGEALSGTMKIHVGYARRAEAPALATPAPSQAVPHLSGVEKDPRLAQKIGAQVSKQGNIKIGGEDIDLSKKSGALIAKINGQATLAEIAASQGLDPIGFSALWTPFEKAFTRWNKLHYSRLLHRS